MSKIQSSLMWVEWRLSAQGAPMPCVPCSHCGCIRPFQSSGKARINANGKRLDAWLVYHCVTCGNSWNRTIFERRPVSTIAPEILEALQSNSFAWLEGFASDRGELAKLGVPLVSADEVRVRRRLLSLPIGGPVVLQIDIVLVTATELRLDRLLARELNISRSQLQSLARNRILTFECGYGKALKKPIGQDMTLRLDLSATALGEPIASSIRRHEAKGS